MYIHTCIYTHLYIHQGDSSFEPFAPMEAVRKRRLMHTAPEKIIRIRSIRVG